MLHVERMLELTSFDSQISISIHLFSIYPLKATIEGCGNRHNKMTQCIN